MRNCFGCSRIEALGKIASGWANKERLEILEIRLLFLEKGRVFIRPERLFGGARRLEEKRGIDDQIQQSKRDQQSLDNF